MSFSITGLDQGTYPPSAAGQTAWRFMLLASLASRLFIHLCGRLRSVENCVVMSKVRMVEWSVVFISPMVLYVRR